MPWSHLYRITQAKKLQDFKACTYSILASTDLVFCFILHKCFILVYINFQNLIMTHLLLIIIFMIMIHVLVREPGAPGS